MSLALALSLRSEAEREGMYVCPSLSLRSEAEREGMYVCPSLSLRSEAEREGMYVCPSLSLSLSPFMRWTRRGHDDDDDDGDDEVVVDARARWWRARASRWCASREARGGDR